MTEALKVLIGWALKQKAIHRVWAVCDIDNIASARVMEKVGMQREGILNNLLISYCEDALAHRKRKQGSFRSAVENAIAPLLPHGKATAADVARQLGLSQRTFARRLSSEGLTFSELLENLRSNLASRYLVEGDMGVSEVAWLLGYREVGSFSHAFRRWTGKTPREVLRAERSRPGTWVNRWKTVSACSGGIPGPSSSTQIVVAVFPRLPSPSLEDFTVRTAQAWRVGGKQHDNGAVLFVFVEERKLRIETGYGLEGALPDQLAGRILDEQVRPRFRAGDWTGGLEAGIDGMIAATRGEYEAPPARRPAGPAWLSAACQHPGSCSRRQPGPATALRLAGPPRRSDGFYLFRYPPLFSLIFRHSSSRCTSLQTIRSLRTAWLPIRQRDLDVRPFRAERVPRGELLDCHHVALAVQKHRHAWPLRDRLLLQLPRHDESSDCPHGHGEEGRGG